MTTHYDHYSARLINSALIGKVQSYFIPNISLEIPASLGDNISLVATMQVNLQELGFGLSPEAIRLLSHLDKSTIVSTYKDIVSIARESVGAHRVFSPMYPNFPKQVIDASGLELFINALIHYSGDILGFRYMPAYSEEPREEMALEDSVAVSAEESAKLRVISIVGASAVAKLFVSMVSANTSKSSSDIAILSEMFKFLPSIGIDIIEVLASIQDIPQKETKAIVQGLIVADSSISPEDTCTLMCSMSNTVTDVLRFAVYLFSAKKDVSLSSAPRFASFKRGQRKLVLAMLNHVLSNTRMASAVEDAASRREVWVRLAEKLHVGDYATKFPKAVEFFNALKDVSAVIGSPLNGRVDKAIASSDLLKAINLLKIKPGVMARSLKKVLNRVTSGEEGSALVSAFAEVADQVSTPVLLQVHAQFKQDSVTSRTFLPKGLTSKVFVESDIVRKACRIEAPSKATIADKLPSTVLESLKSMTLPKAELPVEDNLLIRRQLAAVARATLVTRFSKLEPLGSVFVDSDLSEQFIPAGARSASKAFKTVARGSKTALPDNKPIVRVFIWWKDLANGQRVDIDTSFAFYDDNYQLVDKCTFTKLRTTGVTHSGDITSAPNGACEFIDIDKSKIPENFRYAVMVINSYTSQNYSEMEECFAGVMTRSAGQSGKIFDGRTVVNKFDLTADTAVVVPIAVDLKENKIIWMDASLNSNEGAWNMIESQSDRISYMLQGFNELVRPTLQDLFLMHAEARGTLVESIEDADTVFSMYQGVTPFDYEVISSEYMADPS